MIKWIAAVAVPLVLFAAPVQAADTGLELSWEVTDQATGAVEVRVHNPSSRQLAGWQVSVPFSQPVTDVSGAISVQDTEHLTLWSDDELGAQQDRVVRLTIEPLGLAVATPGSCESSRGDCRVRIPAAADPTPVVGERSETAPGDLSLSYRVENDWGSGQSIIMSVTNNGSVATSQWQVEVPAGVHVDGMWGAENLSGGGVIRAGSIDANRYLAPGEGIEFGFDVVPGGNLEWRDCDAVVDGNPATCGIAAADSWTAYPEFPSQW